MSIRQAADLVPLAEDVAGLLAISDERDRWSALVKRSERTMFRIGYGTGYDAGYRQGRDDEHAEAAERWRQAAVAIKEHIPETPEWKASVNRRIAAALAGERRDAADHERAFVARAFATPAYLRNDVERATVRLYGRRIEAAA